LFFILFLVKVLFKIEYLTHVNAWTHTRNTIYWEQYIGFVPARTHSRAPNILYYCQCKQIGQIAFLIMKLFLRFSDFSYKELIFAPILLLFNVKFALRKNPSPNTEFIAMTRHSKLTSFVFILWLYRSSNIIDFYF